MRSTKAVLAILVLTFVGGVLLHSYQSVAQEAPPAAYVTSGKLHQMCHKKQYDVWSQTLHAKQKATPDASADAKYRHMTGFEQKGDAAEPGVSCDACHAPGKPHMDAPLTAKKGTSMVPTTLKDPLAALAVCGRCHSQGAMADATKYPKSFVWGKKLPDDYKLAATVEGDTRLRQLNDMQQSKHAEKGVTCVTCHTSHAAIEGQPQLRKAINDLCNDCHAAQADMKHATAAKPDSKCSDCHMPGKHHVFKVPAA